MGECKERGPITDMDADFNPVERPNSLTLAQRALTLKSESGPKFYGQSHPTVAVHTSWEECKAACIGVKGARFKSFTSEAEAWEWAKNPPARTSKPKTKTPEEEEAAAKKKEEAAAKKAEKDKEKADAKAAKVTEKEAAKKDKADAKNAVKQGKEDAKAAKEQAKEEGKSAKDKAKDQAKAAKEAKEEVKAAKAATTAASKKRKAPANEKAHPSKEDNAAGTRSPPPTALAEVPTPCRPENPEKKAKTTPEKMERPRAAKGRGKKDEDSSKLTAAVAIDDVILQEARELNFETALRNLAARPEIVARGLETRALLDALKTSEGLVNSAKHALLAQ